MFVQKKALTLKVARGRPFKVIARGAQKHVERCVDCMGEKVGYMCYGRSISPRGTATNVEGGRAVKNNCRKNFRVLTERRGTAPLPGSEPGQRERSRDQKRYGDLQRVQ